jgi:hypothetical protein
MKDISLFGLLLFFLFSCQGEKNKENITRLVNKWQGREMIFPENIVFTRYLTDTTDKTNNQGAGSVKSQEGETCPLREKHQSKLPQSPL